MEEALDGSLYHRAPGPIVFFVEVGTSLLELFPVVLQTLVEGGVLRMTRPVGASARSMLYRKRLAGRIYEVFGSGVFKSTDGAGSWTAAHSGLITGSHVWTLAIGPTNPTTLRGSRTLACPLVVEYLVGYPRAQLGAAAGPVSTPALPTPASGRWRSTPPSLPSSMLGSSGPTGSNNFPDHRGRAARHPPCRSYPPDVPRSYRSCSQQAMCIEIVWSCVQTCVT